MLLLLLVFIEVSSLIRFELYPMNNVGYSTKEAVLHL